MPTARSSIVASIRRQEQARHRAERRDRQEHPGHPVAAARGAPEVDGRPHQEAPGHQRDDGRGRDPGEPRLELALGALGSASARPRGLDPACHLDILAPIPGGRPRRPVTPTRRVPRHRHGGARPTSSARDPVVVLLRHGRRREHQDPRRTTTPRPATASGSRCTSAGLTPGAVSRPQDDHRGRRARARADRPGRPLGPRDQPRLGRDRPAAWPTSSAGEPAWLAVHAARARRGTPPEGARPPQARPRGRRLGRRRGRGASSLPGTSGANQRKDYDGRPEPARPGGATWPRSRAARAAPSRRDRRHAGPRSPSAGASDLRKRRECDPDRK